MIKTNIGFFTAQDALGETIVLEWEKVVGQSTRLSDKINEVSTILAETYTRQELDFARAHPDLVRSEYFLKVIAPLFASGADKVDWAEAETQLRETFLEMFNANDFDKYVTDSEVSLFVIAKEKSSKIPLGVIQFLITPDFEEGTIKSAYFGVATAAKDRGIELLLMSAAFKLLPDTQRIFMHTRTTNEAMTRLYQSWGFVSFPGPLRNWIDLEYLSDKSGFLQGAAKELL